jgi:hypothetical protein
LAVTVIDFPSSLPTGQQTVPVEIPTVAEDVVAENVYLEYAHFTNGGSSSAVVTVKDKQGTPLEVFRVTCDATAPVSWRPERRYCPGGINWVSSAAGVIGYLRWSK